MTNGSGYFGYESVVLAALAALAGIMLSAFAHAVINATVLI